MARSGAAAEQNSSVTAQTHPEPAWVNDEEHPAARAGEPSLKRRDRRSVLSERTLEHRFDEKAGRWRSSIVFRSLNYIPRGFWRIQMACREQLKANQDRFEWDQCLRQIGLRTL
jgi:hypothetical protein